MRVAVLSDIHGNLTAFEAVLAELQRLAPDVVLHGGDLADTGSSPVEVVDRIRELGWQGVMGNTDQMLVDPESLETFASQSAAPAALWNTVREIAQETRSRLGEQRLAWLRTLPLIQYSAGIIALVHASPQSYWRAPPEDASEAMLEEVYGVLDQPVVAFGHTHRPFVRGIGQRRLANSGSVGLPYDGDPRASFLLFEDGVPSIRRVAYDMERELRALAASGMPGAAWTARMLRTAAPQSP